MAMGEQHNHQRVKLEPGFRFHPTDEEIITHYLTHKAFNKRFSTIAIGEIDINKFEPWELPGKAKMGEMEWYFYCQMDQKYPTGTRVNRATRAGFWKATGKDKEIYHGATRVLIGKKKTLVFYKGRAHNDEKTNWVMHEYHLDSRFQYPNNQNPIAPTKDEWVVSKIFQKISRVKNLAMPIASADASRSLSMSIGEEGFVGGSNSLPSLMHPSYCTTTSVIDTSATLEMGQIWNASPLLHNPLLQTMFNHEVNNVGYTHNQENVGSTHNQEGQVQTTTLDMTEQLSNITSGWGLPLTVLGTDLHAATGNISSMTSSVAAVNLDVDGTWKY